MLFSHALLLDKQLDRPQDLELDEGKGNVDQRSSELWSGKPVARLNQGFNNAIRASYIVKKDPLIPLNALFDRRSFAGLSLSSADNAVGFPAFNKVG